jgi:hypothetical protein
MVTRDARCERETKETANGKKPKGRMIVHIEAPKFPGHEFAASPSLKNWATAQEDGRYIKNGQSGNRCYEEKHSVRTNQRRVVSQMSQMA